MCFGIKLRQKLAGPQKSPASTLNPFLVVGHPSVPFPLRTGKALILKTFSFTKDLGQVAALSRSVTNYRGWPRWSLHSSQQFNKSKGHLNYHCNEKGSFKDCWKTSRCEDFVFDFFKYQKNVFGQWSRRNWSKGKKKSIVKSTKVRTETRSDQAHDAYLINVRVSSQAQIFVNIPQARRVGLC